MSDPATLAEALAEIARLRAERDAMAPLFTLALRAVEAGDVFDYMAARDEIRALARAYRMAEAAQEWKDEKGPG